MAENEIGFFAMPETRDGKGYIGALLVTDELGKPLEFRVTYPVKPNVLQITLYGESLIPHIGIELCGKPLVKALTHTPSLIVVSDQRYLGFSGGQTNFEACLERLGESIKVGEEDRSPVQITSPSRRFSPLAVTYPPGYTDVERDQTQAMLERFFTAIDLLEPFKRISVALEALADQDGDFR